MCRQWVTLPARLSSPAGLRCGICISGWEPAPSEHRAWLKHPEEICPEITAWPQRGFECVGGVAEQLVWSRHGVTVV